MSSDRDESSFDEYYKEMPWLAVPFAARDEKAAASTRLGVQGIPMLVALDPQGNVVTKEGRKMITTEPKGFPWKSEKLSDLMTPDLKLVDNKGEAKTLGDLKGKTLGLYFSAHWCPPCKAFTPKFADVYKKCKESGKDFEVIFLSSDSDEDAFKEYFAEMPWLALPYDQRQLKEKLSGHFGVEGIPTLVLLDENMKVITDEATGPIRSDPDTAHNDFPWMPKPVNEIDENPSGIDEAPALVVLQNKIGEDKRKANLAVISEIADEASKNAASDDAEDEKENIFAAEPAKPFKFFLSSKDGQLGDRVRSECKVPDDDKVHVVLMDIPAGGAYYSWDDSRDLSKDSVSSFLADYRAGKLEKKQMGA